MIEAADLTMVGKVNKTHGICGELSMSFFSQNIMDAIEPGACMIFDIDGIFTPFFVGAVRPRGNESLLVTFDGEGSQEQASFFVGRTAFMLTQSLPAQEEVDDEEDGLYAGQLIGYQAIDAADNKLIGEIVDIDEQTQNVLFIIERPQGDTVYIPVADEFIQDLSTENKTITFDLPEGLIS